MHIRKLTERGISELLWHNDVVEACNQW